jgi:hypothetical protein
MTALTIAQREIIAGLQSGRLMICEGQGDPNSDGCGGQGYTGATGREPCRHCYGAGVMTVELRAALMPSTRNLAQELQSVMETLDDLDLLYSSEIVRAARDQVPKWMHPDEAQTRRSYIVSAPWPDGQPFRGEGVREDDGRWYWANGKLIERSVNAVCEFPNPA